MALVLMLALVGGGTLGVTGAFGREFLQNLVRSPRQLETELGVKTVGSVPNVLGSPVMAAQLKKGLRRLRLCHS